MINYVNPGKVSVSRKAAFPFWLILFFLKLQKSELNACAWLGDLDTSSDGEEDTDTYLAVGGNDSLVQIISIARCRVICILRGASLLCSLCAVGLRLWGWWST